MITYRIGNENDIEHIAELLFSSWQNCYSDFMPSSFLNNLNKEKQIQRHTQYMVNQTQYFVAENEEKEIVGFASYGSNRLQKYIAKMRFTHFMSIINSMVMALEKN